MHALRNVKGETMIGPDWDAEVDEVDAYHRASEDMEEFDFNAAKPALQFLLTRIGSWTNARYDQHLRNEFGDENAERAIRWIEATFDVKGFAQTKALEKASDH